MTIKNKIATSLVASTLLVTAAFAAQGNGDLAYSSGKNTATIAEELYQFDGDFNASIGSATNYMVYTSDLDGSGTVSDAAVKLTFSSPVEKVNAGDKFSIFDLTDGNKTIAVEIAYNTTTNTVTFDSDSQYTFADGKKYGIAVIDNSFGPALGVVVTAAKVVNTAAVNGTKAQHDAFNAKLELYSTSGTEVLRDVATVDMFTVTPQYSVTCDNKFNNLINVENSSLTFVSTKHGVEDTVTGAIGDDIMETLTDVMRFTVTKTAVDFGLDGNGSKLIISADNNVTFPAAFTSGNASSNFADKVVGNAVTITAKTNNTSDIIVADPAGNVGSTLANTFYGLGTSENTFTVNLKANGTAAIPETKFTANFYIQNNEVNTGTTYTPAGSYDAGSVIGQWSNFAYIGQIAGATEDASTKTKLFVVNRSCKAVSPIVTLIKDGAKTVVTLAEVAVDSQGKYLLGDILDTAGLAQGRYAVEITIPGNAEDFYVYAQAQSRTDLAATKDLPVYNTSTRD